MRLGDPSDMPSTTLEHLPLAVPLEGQTLTGLALSSTLDRIYTEGSHACFFTPYILAGDAIALLPGDAEDRCHAVSLARGLDWVSAKPGGRRS